MALSNVLAVGLWTAFLSVLAIIGIIVAGGFIVALIGKAILSIFNNGKADQSDSNEYGYINTNNVQDEYKIEQERSMQKSVESTVKAEDDYSYALDVDESKAKDEEKALNKELSNSKDEDDFFKDFSGDNDARFNDVDDADIEDDELLDMINEISNDVLDEEEQTNSRIEQEQSDKNKSVLDEYSIDNFFNEEQEEPQDEEILSEEFIEETQDNVETMVDKSTMEEINALKEQVEEIIEAMEDNNNKNATFNEQLINILNELKEANKKGSEQIKTEEDAEREINELKQQLEDSRVEMERQLQEKIADKDAEMQARLQEQLDASNAEIEDLKAQLSALLAKMEEPEGDEADEIKPIEEESEISALRNEVKEMLESMREENDAKNTEFNAQLIAILNEMKEATLKKSEDVKIETAEEAVDEVNAWQEELELAEKELQKQFKEEMAHKDDEEKAELRAQMESYNEEIGELKAQLASLMDAFKQESESSKAENQALIDQLEAERQERISLEKEKLDNEKAQEAQLDSLRKENEALADKLQAREQATYEPLTDDEIDDLYSEATTIDYSAIKQMNEEQIDEKVKRGLEQSKAEIDELKEQVSRLNDFIEKREQELAGQINVHEVRTADFDVEQIKEITAQEVEERVKEKLADSLAEIEALRSELRETKQELENQYKEQLANVDAGMEYDKVSKLQESAEKIDDIDSQLNDLTESLEDEQENAKTTSEECVAELETTRENKTEEARQAGFEEDVAVIGPKNNKVALISSDVVEAEKIEEIDIVTVKQLTNAEIDEMIEKRLQASNNEIDNLKEQIAQLKADLIQKDEEMEKAQAEMTSVPVVRSPLFDVEAIKTITAQEVEAKVQERLAEAMKEIEEMKRQLEISKQEIEREYKEQIAKNQTIETELRDKLKDSAAEVVDLKEQLSDLTEQIELEHQEAKENSEAIAVQLEQDRKEKEEIAKQQLTFGQETNEMAVMTTAEVTVIGPKNNQVALVTGVPALSEEVGEIEDIPTIDIETVKKLTEQEIEEKVEQRMATSIIEIEELKKQILNLSIQIQEIKSGESDGDDEKPMVFHYSTEDAYLERIAILEERLKIAKKDLKINNKELNPLQKVNRTLERDKAKLRRKEAIAAKKKVALYGVNNYVDIDKEKAEKLAQELELLDGLRLSVSHCEEVMSANIDRYPILLHTDQILRENIANIEGDIATLNKELQVLREKNGSSAN